MATTIFHANVRIKRLQEQNAELESKLEQMTSIADVFNQQLRALFLGLGAEKFNKIVGPIAMPKDLQDESVPAAQPVKGD